MMGAHHAVCGAATWVAITGTGPLMLGWYPMGPTQVAAGGLVCAGAALLPDADHHRASIARSLPPISGWICAGVGAVSGGHRHATHSLLAALAATALAWALHLITAPTSAGDLAVGAGALAVVLFALAARALHLTRGTITAWVCALVAGAFVAEAAPHSITWLPLAVGLGYVVHIAGDMLTTGGVPLLWPLTPRPSQQLLTRAPLLARMWRTNGYVAVPVLGNTGSVREWILALAISAYTALGALWVLTRIIVG